MNNKNIKILLLALLCFQLSFAQQKTVKLSGTLINFSSQVMVEDMSEYQYLKPQSPDRIIIPDSAGKFSITFNLAEPNYFRIGRNAVYLSPGDQLNATINYNNPKLATFSGTGAAANTYMMDTPFPKGGSFLEAGKSLKPTARATFDIIMEAAGKRSDQLEKLTGTSAEFKRLEKARIKADVLISYNALNAYLKIMKTTTLPDTFLRAFEKLAAPVKKSYSQGLRDQSLMKLVVYRDIADGIVQKNAADKASIQINDWYYSYALVKRMETENDKAKLALYKKSIDSVRTPGYKLAVNEYFNTLMRFGKGDLAVDFKAVSMNGTKVSLSDLKGKVIYVDLWATWCGPCLAEMPQYEALKAKFKDNPDVVILSLSIDDDHSLDKWKKNVLSRNADGYQWQIDRSKLSAYNIVGIPRTLLIDKNFRIVNMNAPLPSAKNAEATIRKLLE